MKDFTEFTKNWWQLVFTSEKCLDICKPMGSSSWDYYLKMANKKHHQSDDEMLKNYGHTKRCGVCDIPMNAYAAIKETLGEEMEASWKREGEMKNQQIMILCIYCLELMTVKEKGMTMGTTVKLASTDKLIDVIKEHPTTHPDYFEELKRRPKCVH